MNKTVEDRETEWLKGAAEWQKAVEEGAKVIHITLHFYDHDFEVEESFKNSTFELWHHGPFIESENADDRNYLKIALLSEAKECTKEDTDRYIKIVEECRSSNIKGEGIVIPCASLEYFGPEYGDGSCKHVYLFNDADSADFFDSILTHIGGVR